MISLVRWKECTDREKFRDDGLRFFLYSLRRQLSPAGNRSEAPDRTEIASGKKWGILVSFE